MSGVALYDYQQDAVNRMQNGCILCGGVGSGKSRTGLAFYYIKNGGQINTKRYVKMHDPPQDLYTPSRSFRSPCARNMTSSCGRGRWP